MVPLLLLLPPPLFAKVRKLGRRRGALTKNTCLTPGLVYPRLHTMDCAKIPVDTVRRFLQVRHATPTDSGYVVVLSPKRLLDELDRVEVLHQLAQAKAGQGG